MKTGTRFWRFKFFNAALVLNALFLLSACYVLPVRKVEGRFQGLNHASERVAAQDGTLRLLIVHGMGPHDDGYEQTLVQGLTKRMQFHELHGSPSPAIEFSKSGHLLGKLTIRDFANSNDDRRLRVYALNWTPSTEGWKKEKLQNDLAYQKYRLAGDAALKDSLMDKALSDVVLYLGRYKQHMQYPIMKAVSQILRDINSPGDELAIITHSLGSYMTYDTLLKMGRGESILGEHPFDKDKVKQLMGRTNSVYMMANQLPLLELSEVSNPPSRRLKGDSQKPSTLVVPESASSSANLMQQFAVAREKQLPSRLRKGTPFDLNLHLVAFSDPNDLLSYPLNAKDVAASHQRVTQNHVDYSNVTTTIAHWSLFWIAVNPMKAHTGHDSDRFVLNLLANGFPQ
jgi:hypothetical protein